MLEYKVVWNKKSFYRAHIMKFTLYSQISYLRELESFRTTTEIFKVTVFINSWQVPSHCKCYCKVSSDQRRLSVGKLKYVADKFFRCRNSVRKIDFSNVRQGQRIVGEYSYMEKEKVLIKGCQIKINFSFLFDNVFRKYDIFAPTRNFVRFNFSRLIHFEYLSLSKHKRALFNRAVVLRGIMSLYIDVAIHSTG